MIVGLAQACALIPGVSRSGSTLTAGLFLDRERDAVAKYFLPTRLTRRID